MSCGCSAQAAASGKRARHAATRLATCSGSARPVVSHRPISASGRSGTRRSRRASAASSGTRPVNGQSKAVARLSRIVTSGGMAASRRSYSASDSSGWRWTLLRLCASVTDTTNTRCLAPAATASRPRRSLGTSTWAASAGSRAAAVRTSAVSRSCGTALALTNEPISTRRTPAATSRSRNRILVSVGMNGPMGWKPSRGPTSTISTACPLDLSHQITPSCRSAAISAGCRPSSSRMTSSVCAPIGGPGQRTAPGSSGTWGTMPV